MANLRAIRQRIRSVQNTQKITRAMQMVAGAKLRRSHEELIRFRPYAERLKTITERFLTATPALEHPLVSKPTTVSDTPRVSDTGLGLILISSDTGLCGTYNERVLSLAHGFLSEHPTAVTVVIGKKGHRRLTRLNRQPRRAILDWGGRYDAGKTEELARGLQVAYLAGEVSAWWVVYVRFVSALSWKPVAERWLPVERSGAVPEGGASPLPEPVIAEPDAAAVADALLNESVRAAFRQMVLEAFTSEHSARMLSMRNATDNASEMIETLTQVRNKARQAAITTELIEVVSGANALQ